MVLFLFVVMMLDINIDRLREGFWKHLPLAGLVGAVIALEMALVLLPRLRRAAGADAGRRRAPKLGNTKLLGIAIYTKYLYPLQIAAVLLLVAIIAAIALTLRRRKDSQATSDPSEQVQGEEGRPRAHRADEAGDRAAARPRPTPRREKPEHEPRPGDARPLPVAGRASCSRCR